MNIQLSEEEKGRYSRHLMLSEIGEEGQLKLKKATVLVIGAGGLGCPVLQYLVAAGVGHIGIVDFDTVEITNLQRQVLYTIHDIGIAKVLAAKNRLEALNPLVQIDTYAQKITVNNAIDIIKKYDIIVDASDNFMTRYLVNDACLITNKPLVYGAIFKFEGQVAVFNYQGGASYRCLFESPPANGEMPSCSEIGVLGVLPGIVGTMQANEVLKIILEIGEVLTNKLWVFNALEHSSMCLTITPNISTIEETKRKDITKVDYETFCGLNKKIAMKEITPQELSQEVEKYVLVDVRELFEQPRYDLLAGINLPLPRLLSGIDQIPKDKPVVMICQKGIRSQIAIDILKKQYDYTNLINLKGGVYAWKKMEEETTKI